MGYKSFQNFLFSWYHVQKNKIKFKGFKLYYMLPPQTTTAQLTNAHVNTFKKSIPLLCVYNEFSLQKKNATMKTRHTICIFPFLSTNEQHSSFYFFVVTFFFILYVCFNLYYSFQNIMLCSDRYTDYKVHKQTVSQETWQLWNWDTVVVVKLEQLRAFTTTVSQLVEVMTGTENISIKNR